MPTGKSAAGFMTRRIRSSISTQKGDRAEDGRPGRSPRTRGGQAPCAGRYLGSGSYRVNVRDPVGPARSLRERGPLAPPRASSVLRCPGSPHVLVGEHPARLRRNRRRAGGYCPGIDGRRPGPRSGVASPDDRGVPSARRGPVQVSPKVAAPGTMIADSGCV
jgi:hypothetical protein